MFLEKWGQFFFLRMRPAFFFILTLCPLILVSLILTHESSKLRDLETRFAKAARKERLSLERKTRREKFLKRYSNPNPYFLDQQIESVSLLENERHKLTSLLHHPAFPESEAIRNRLHFLDENRLFFTEGKIETSSRMKEVEEKQRRPVEMDESDLKKVLSLIEDLPVDSFLPSAGSPQLLIKEFRLKKQTTQLHTEVFEVEIELLKREFSES